MDGQVATTKPKPRRRRLLLAGGFIVASVIIVVLVWRSLQQPANGTINSKNNGVAPSQVNSVTYKQLIGQTFTLEYPSTFSPEAMSSKSHYTGLDNFILATSNIAGNDHLAVAVAKVEGPLESDSSFHYRTLHPELYTEVQQKPGGETIYVFTKTTEGYEQTIFMPHKDVLGTIALTSTRPEKEEHAATMAHILQTFHWHLP